MRCASWKSRQPLSDQALRFCHDTYSWGLPRQHMWQPNGSLWVDITLFPSSVRSNQNAEFKRNEKKAVSITIKTTWAELWRGIATVKHLKNGNSNMEKVTRIKIRLTEQICMRPLLVLTVIETQQLIIWLTFHFGNTYWFLKKMPHLSRFYSLNKQGPFSSMKWNFCFHIV